MAMINVNCETSDAFYRYKMPSLIAKVEGKGNGIKTVIVNMTEVGKALGRPPAYPCKFFGCELGAQIQIDRNNRFIVNGAHEQPKLQELVHGFIKKFVLCQECDNPETILKAGKTKITMSCKACGFTGLLDMRHKLTTYILRHPPESYDGASVKKHEKGGKKGKSKSKEASSPDEEADEDGQFGKFGSLSKADKKRSDEDEEWGEETDEQAVTERMKVLSNGVASLAMTNDSEKPHRERGNIFFAFVKSILEEGSIPAIARDLGKVKAEAERLDVMDDAPVFLAELMYTKDVEAEIMKYRPIMIHFVSGHPKGQKALLGAYEIIVGKEHPELLARAGHILKAFYDADLLDEEVILEWAAKIHKKHVSKDIARQIHEKAAPFVEWLKSAEEESSEEEEDEVEVVYTNDQQTTVNTAAQNGEGDDEDDIDIDNI